MIRNEVIRLIIMVFVIKANFSIQFWLRSFEIVQIMFSYEILPIYRFLLKIYHSFCHNNRSKGWDKINLVQYLSLIAYEHFETIIFKMKFSVTQILYTKALFLVFVTY